ncbi:MAG: hypothetical protein OXH15_19435 [Gammaproteobacteria bacterium]|nr:hypothetical protein [Gammaproteobacteria bacterium]
MAVGLPILGRTECESYTYDGIDMPTLRRAAGLDASNRDHEDALGRAYNAAVEEVAAALGMGLAKQERHDWYDSLERRMRLSAPASVVDEDKPRVFVVAGDAETEIPAADVRLRGRYDVYLGGTLANGEARVSYHSDPAQGRYAIQEAVLSLAMWRFRSGQGERGTGGRPLAKPNVRAAVRRFAVRADTQVIG